LQFFQLHRLKVSRNTFGIIDLTNSHFNVFTGLNHTQKCQDAIILIRENDVTLATNKALVRLLVLVFPSAFYPTHLQTHKIRQWCDIQPSTRHQQTRNPQYDLIPVDGHWGVDGFSGVYVAMRSYSPWSDYYIGW
jgi:hypothetical protein